MAFNRDREAAKERLRDLLDSVCLRRSTECLNLPPLLEVDRELEFSADEKYQYVTTKELMDRLIREQASNVRSSGNPFGMFQAQLQLRILCNHGTFQKRDLRLEREEALASFGRYGEVGCSFCKETLPMLSAIRAGGSESRCRHMLCPDCVADQSDADDLATGAAPIECPVCTSANTKRARIDCHAMKPQFRKDTRQHHHSFNEPGTSTKIMALMADLEEGLMETKRFYSPTIFCPACADDIAPKYRVLLLDDIFGPNRSTSSPTRGIVLTDRRRLSTNIHSGASVESQRGKPGSWPSHQVGTGKTCYSLSLYYAQNS
jgi:hypothetical protein